MEFDYQNMLNKIRDVKMTKNKNPDFSEKEIAIWNNAIALCYGIVELRRSKFEPSDSDLNIPYCPDCGSSDTYETKLKNNYRCYDCHWVWAI